jgi:hypothetical protein
MFPVMSCPADALPRVHDHPERFAQILCLRPASMGEDASILQNQQQLCHLRTCRRSPAVGTLIASAIARVCNTAAAFICLAAIFGAIIQQDNRILIILAAAAAVAAPFCGLQLDLSVDAAEGTPLLQHGTDNCQLFPLLLVLLEVTSSSSNKQRQQQQQQQQRNNM